MKVVKSAAVAEPRGPYSQGLLIDSGKKWLYLSGQVAVDRDGAIPEGIEQQSRLVWDNIETLLGEAGMAVPNIVKVTTYLTSADFMPGFGAVRAECLAAHRPASTLLIVSELANPKFLVEVDIVAAS